MAKRLFDIVCALVGLILASPLLLLVAIGVHMSSPGPILFRARRAGRGGLPFEMLKFRTMQVGDGGTQITAPGDARVFPLGAFLRLTKIDELPQLVNILRGEMSVVGPRPEAVSVVEQSYTEWMRETLRVRPGVTSPGAIYNYTHGNLLIDPSDPDGSYVASLLGPKLALERVYVERAGLPADVGVIMRTAWTIVQMIAGRQRFPLPREAEEARRWHIVPGA